MKLSLILEAIDRISGPARKAADSVGKLGDRARAATGPARRAAEAVDRMGKSSQTAERQVTRVSAATFKWTRLALRSADAMDRATASAARFAGRAGLKAVEMAGHGAGRAISFARTKMLSLLATTARWAAVSAVAGVGIATRSIIATGSKFEQFEAQLVGTEGSVAKARSALGWVAKFAAETPYQIDEVTDAFVRARGVGIDPMTGAMRQMGDAAAGTRKSIMDAVEAVADAQTGEFERLKEFNITTSVKGDKVTFEYLDKAGKNARRTVSKDMASIREAVLSVFGEKYGDGMVRQSRTLSGIWSNLQDKVAGFQLKVAAAGFYDRVKQQLASLLGWTDRLEKNGTLDRWAKAVSDNLSAAFEWGVRFVKETDWESVGATLKVVGGVLKWILELLRDIHSAASAAGDAIRWANNTRLSDAMGLTTPAPKPVMPALRKPSAADWMGAARSLNAPARPGFAPPLNRPAAPRAPLAAPKGKLEVTIKTPPGVQARPTKVAANDMDLTVNTGKAMGGWA